MLSRPFRVEDTSNPMYVNFADDIFIEVWIFANKKKKIETQRYLVPARVVHSYMDGLFGLLRVVASRKSFYDHATGEFRDERNTVNYQGCSMMGQKIIYNEYNYNRGTDG